MTSFAREIPVKTPEHFTEGPFVHHHGGRYYLSYSHGNYRDASYSVHYATGETAIGPWTYQGVILASDRRHKGPGHHSLVRLPGKDRWFIVYHRWNDREGNGPFTGKRETCIDRLEHTPDGKITRVVMTDTSPMSDSDTSVPEHVDVLVVGAGRIAARKAQAYASQGALLTVVAPDHSPYPCADKMSKQLPAPAFNMRCK